VHLPDEELRQRGVIYQTKTVRQRVVIGFRGCPSAWGKSLLTSPVRRVGEKRGDAENLLKVVRSHRVALGRPAAPLGTCTIGTVGETNRRGSERVFRRFVS
jgi:hypothetical protein